MRVIEGKVMMYMKDIPCWMDSSFPGIGIERALVGVLAAIATMTALRSAVVDKWELERICPTRDRRR